jgi:hypothetical protein
MVDIRHGKGCKSPLNIVQVTALFYDGKGNPISNNPLISNVIPNISNTFEDETLAFNVSVNNDLNGINPLYIVLSYCLIHNLDTNGGSPSNQFHPINLFSQVKRSLP